MKWIYRMNRMRVSRGDKLILDDVTLAFLPGAKIGVVGPNGAGKSTMLQIMAGLEQPSHGEAMLARGVSVGILLQEPPLDEARRASFIPSALPGRGAAVPLPPMFVPGGT